MNKKQINRKIRNTFFHRPLPVLPLRWSQHVPPKVGTVLSQYLASHPRTSVFNISAGKNLKSHIEECRSKK